MEQPPPIEQFIDELYSTDLDVVLKCTQQLANVFYLNSSLVDKFISLNAVSRLEELLLLDNLPDVQIGASRLLYTILTCATERLSFVVERDVCSALVRLLDSDDPAVAREAAWTLSNVTLRRPQLRAVLIKLGYARALCGLVQTDAPEPLLLAVTDCMSNLLSGDQASPEIIMAFRPAIRELLHSDSPMVVQKACIALSTVFEEAGFDYTSELEDRAILRRLVAIVHAGRHERCNGSLLRSALTAIRSILKRPTVRRRSEVMRRALQRQGALWDAAIGQGLMNDLFVIQALYDNETRAMADRLEEDYRTARQTKTRAAMLRSLICLDHIAAYRYAYLVGLIAVMLCIVIYTNLH